MPKGFKKGHKHSEETKMKIGLANSVEWIKYKCDYCGKKCEERPSHYNRKKKHFCSTSCYALYRKNILTPEQQNNWRGGRYEAHKRWKAKNPERMAHLKARRYARKKGAEGSHTLKEWEDLKIDHLYLCAICNVFKPLTRDHIIPLSKGGTDYIGNIQPLCRSCNSKKWTFIYKKPKPLTYD